MSDKVAEIVGEYVKYTDLDYVGLWQIIKRARHELKIVDQMELKEAVLHIVRELLSTGLEAITLLKTGPVRWENQDIDSVLNRVSQEWDALGRDPNPGEIVWFDRKRS